MATFFYVIDKKMEHAVMLGWRTAWLLWLLVLCEVVVFDGVVAASWAERDEDCGMAATVDVDGCSDGLASVVAFGIFIAHLFPCAGE
ncbi:hypothetical protein C1H46_008270 [Malus baccata]|uniref:Uncharacterized protein n=1 Tax=Malus baccata TaxID=106549 RepID=A0A540N4W7_MALBA|nr:hypothetical protein C1H46_008270 [Malus baccata]